MARCRTQPPSSRPFNASPDSPWFPRTLAACGKDAVGFSSQPGDRMVGHLHQRGATGSSLNTGGGPPWLERWIAARKGLACGSYVTVMLPPRPGDPSKPFRPSEPLLPLFPLGVPIPPEPPRPPRPPLPPDPPGPPSAFTVSEPPWGSTRYSFSLPAADTPTWRRGWFPDLSATRTCTGGAS